MRFYSSDQANSSNSIPTASTSAKSRDLRVIVPERNPQKQQRASQIINLKQTAQTCSQHIDTISLEIANNKSIVNLENLLERTDTLFVTEKLLQHLEQIKKTLVFDSKKFAEFTNSEHEFLEAYIFATKKQSVFASDSNLDMEISQSACDMIQAFEDLCGFVNSHSKSLSTPQANSPLFQTLDSLALQIQNEKSDTQQRKNKPSFLLTHDGCRYFEEFYKAQAKYYKTYSRWQSLNKEWAIKNRIRQYLKLETIRFNLLTNNEPWLYEQYRDCGIRQHQIKQKIYKLFKEEGLQVLEENIKNHQEELESKRWITASDEVLFHEIATNDKFKLQPKAYEITPQRDFAKAISALGSQPQNTKPIISALVEIAQNIWSLKPHDKELKMYMVHNFNAKAIESKFQSETLENGLFITIYSLLNKLKEFDTSQVKEEIVKFQRQMHYRYHEEKADTKMAIEAVNFIYKSISKIHFQLSEKYIKNAKKSLGKEIIELEVNSFRSQLEIGAITLGNSIKWIHKLVDNHKEFGLDISAFFSEHTSAYVAPILLKNIITNGKDFDLENLPEIFYLDRARLMAWHSQYQKLLFTACTLTTIRMICSQNKIQLDESDIEHHKQYLMSIFGNKQGLTPDEIAAQIKYNVEQFLETKNCKLTKATLLTSSIVNLFTGKEAILHLLKKRFDNALLSHFYTGHLSYELTTKANLYGLEKNLDALCSQIRPSLRLHINVHAEFYQHTVKTRMWKPLFDCVESTAYPKNLQPLIAGEEADIERLHHRIHKLALVLTGMAIIKQKIASVYIWKTISVSNQELYRLANSYKFSDLISNDGATMDMVHQQLIDFMKQVYMSQDLTPHPNEINLGENDNSFKADELSAMLQMARNGNSRGYNEFIQQISRLCQRSAIHDKEIKISQFSLMAGFQVELENISKNIKSIMHKISLDYMAEDESPVKASIPKLRAGKR